MTQNKILETLVSNQTILAQNQATLTILVKQLMDGKAVQTKPTEPKAQKEETKKVSSKTKSSKKASKKPSTKGTRYHEAHLNEVDKKAFKEAKKGDKVRLHLPKTAKKAYLTKLDKHSALFIYEGNKELKIPCHIDFDAEKSTYYKVGYKQA